MQTNPQKEVIFKCKECKYETVKEEDDPCFDCLSEPTNLYSHPPVHFEPKE